MELENIFTVYSQNVLVHEIMKNAEDAKFKYSPVNDKGGDNSSLIVYVEQSWWTSFPEIETNIIINDSNELLIPNGLSHSIYDIIDNVNKIVWVGPNDFDFIFDLYSGDMSCFEKGGEDGYYYLNEEKAVYCNDRMIDYNDGWQVNVNPGEKLILRITMPQG